MPVPLDSTLDPTRYDALTFDCYGTLIDWERGLLAHLAPILQRNDVHANDDFVLSYFAESEAKLEEGPYRSYREVLEGVCDAFGRRFAFALKHDERAALPESIAAWPPFPDTIDALTTLGRHHRLAIISNVDDDLFALSRARLGIEFAEVITAEQVRAYKPDPRVFVEAVRRLRVPRERILHIAQSRYHDIVPARALGIDCVWIDRRLGHGGGATRASEAEANWQFPDLARLEAAFE